MKKKILLFSTLILLSFVHHLKAQEQGIIINEFSNGSSGNQEYIEFLVVGCSGFTVDIRGWIFDDNNGDFFSGSNKSNVGIAPGHSRFSMNAQWANVPVGSIILIYNSDPGQKNTSITLPDDINDANNDSVYVLSHAYPSLIEVCIATPTTLSSNYSCTTYSGGSWTSVSMANAGDATQTRRPDGSYFHGFGWGAGTGVNNGILLNGGPDNLYFSGPGGGRAYSYTAPSCNYRDISNFTSQAVPAGETPGYANNVTNQNYIRFLRKGITAGTISGNQTICSGDIPATLTEFGSMISCYVNYQWQFSTTGIVGSFQNITAATSANYTPSSLTATAYFRRIVTNICQQDTSNIVTIIVSPNITRANQPSTNTSSLCINAPNSAFTTNTIANATSYAWEIYPAGAGSIIGTGTSVDIDWNNVYSGVAKVVVKSLGCGGNQPSDTTFITISNTVAQAGSDLLNVCGTSVTLTASASPGTWSIVSGIGGSFSNGSLYNSIFTGMAGQSYELEWSIPSSACAIASSDRVTISFANIPNAPTTKDTSSCLSGNFVLIASGGLNDEYRWYSNLSTPPIDGEYSNTYTTPLLSDSTTYYVALNNGNCESAKVPINIAVQNVPKTVDAGPDVNTLLGKSVSIGSNTNGTFQWSPSDYLNDPTLPNPTATPIKTTTYVVTQTFPSGCIFRDTMTVNILCDQVTITNLITPNGDDKNDTFIVGCTEKLGWQLEISNRWGDIVYKTNNYNNEWNAHGLSNGVYYFNLTSEVLKLSYKGWVQVLD